MTKEKLHFKKFLFKNSLFLQLTICYTIMLLLFSFLTCFFSYRQKKGELLSQIELTMTQLSQNYQDTASNFWQLYMPIFERSSQAYDVLMNYFIDKTGRELPPLEKYDLSYSLSQMMLRDDQVQWIALYSQNRETNYVYLQSTSSLQEVSNDFPYFSELDGTSKQLKIFGKQLSDSKIETGDTFVICGGIPSRMGNGHVIAGYSLSSLNQICATNTPILDSLQYYLVHNGDLLFTSGGNYESLPSYIPASPFLGSSYDNNGQKKYIDARTCGSKSTFLTCTVSWWEMFFYCHENTPLILLSVFFFALFSVLIYIIMLKFIANEVNTIQKGLDYIGENHLDYKIPTSFRQKGLPEIAQSINHMACQLNENINRAYYYEIRQKEAELSELQSKFNPHFLYNTMEMLRSRCIQNNDEDTAELITSLSAIFRGFIGSTPFIPLQEELTFSKRYLSLFGARYGDEVQVQYDFEPELLQYGIIRNLFQPLIENYFIHGFEASSGEDNYICFRGKSLDSKTMILTVEDNGSGMDDLEIEQLNLQLREPLRLNTESYGLKNLHQRLHLFYGGNCGLNIVRNGQKGLSIQMTVLKMTCADYEALKKINKQ